MNCCMCNRELTPEETGPGNCLLEYVLPTAAEQATLNLGVDDSILLEVRGCNMCLAEISSDYDGDSDFTVTL